jgi:anti-sigma B factor antagonist
VRERKESCLCFLSRAWDFGSSIQTRRMAMDIKVNVKAADDKAFVIEVQGEIDVYTSPRVKESINDLIEKGNYNLVINLEGVRYIDSTGLGVLIGALKKVREHNGRIILICNNPQIKKIFNITGLVKIFEIFKTEEEALKNL